MKVGVVTFPGTLDDVDAARAVRIGGNESVALWHGDHDLKGVDAVILPGGFSYGDYLRCGAISRFSPVMAEVIEAARAGLPVLGICNGFQILVESHLLPGGLLRNDHLKFVCRDQRLRIENASTPWTSAYDEGQEIVVPLKNGEGQYVADAETIARLEGEAVSWPATSRSTPTGRSTTSPASATSAATSSASCRTPSTASRRSPARHRGSRLLHVAGRAGLRLIDR